MSLTVERPYSLLPAVYRPDPVLVAAQPTN